VRLAENLPEVDLASGLAVWLKNVAGNHQPINLFSILTLARSCHRFTRRPDREKGTNAAGPGDGFRRVTACEGFFSETVLIRAGQRMF
jgi:hypothetical protein